MPANMRFSDTFDVVTVSIRSILLYDESIQRLYDLQNKNI